MKKILLLFITTYGLVLSCYSQDRPAMLEFLPAKGKSNGTAVIIFPGGGYGFLATETEGIPAAKAFADKGFTAFVVQYRLPANPKDQSMAPVMDGQLAIKYVREHAARYNLDPAKIGIMGFSAGGHLAASLGTHYAKSFIPNKENTSLRPDFMLLVYPVISMDSLLTHRGSRNNLIGKTGSREQVDFFSAELHVSTNTAPTYLTHTGDDRVVKVKNSIIFYEALVKNKVEAELHLFAKGDHGFTLNQPVEEWLNPMLAFLERQGFYGKKKKKLVFFGDSITQAAVSGDGYIVKLDSIFRSRKKYHYQLIGAGISGNRVEDLSKRLERDVLLKNPDAVVIWIGVNDVWHGKFVTDSNKMMFSRYYSMILDQLKSRGIDVIMCTPGAVGERVVTEDRNQGANKLDAGLNECADSIRAIAKRFNCTVLDLRKEFVNYSEKNNPANAEKGILTSDGVHLNRRGNLFVAEKMWGVIRKLW